MNLKQQIDADLKRAMLAGDKVRTTTLRGLKSVILYAEVASGSRQEGLTDETIVQLLSKESKKRQESADLYKQGGDKSRAEAELEEKRVIAQYLPIQLTDEQLEQVVDATLVDNNLDDISQMGRIIGLVKQNVGATADGQRIAATVKRRMKL